MLQCAAIVLVVLKQLCFDIGGFRLVPAGSPDYGLQTGRVFISPLKTDEASDILKAVRVNGEVDVLMYD